MLIKCIGKHQTNREHKNNKTHKFLFIKTFIGQFDGYTNNYDRGRV